MVRKLFNSLRNRIKLRAADRRQWKQVARVERYIAQNSPTGGDRTVLLFNASTRIHRLSLNGAYSLLASWALRCAKINVVYAVCQQGMQQCILGATLGGDPPCEACMAFSRRLFPADRVYAVGPMDRMAQPGKDELAQAELDTLLAWTYQGYPLGELCLPGLRWALRRHTLIADAHTLDTYRRFVRSAEFLVDRFEGMLEQIQPEAVVVFNGLFYPEAVLRAVARRRGIPVVTHEVGLRPFSAFFSHDDATFREVRLEQDFELDQAQQEQLDRYLQSRVSGRFSMAGIRFWPAMESLPQRMVSRLEQVEQVVTVFTNVIFDTSQLHANSIYPDMLAWLDDLQPLIADHPETMFVLRAHPDEDRPGKASRETVLDWFQRSTIARLENTVFIQPTEYVSSYELIERSKFVLVYNSSIGLEASILGKPVVCAGRARYTQEDTVFTPGSRMAYLDLLERFLGAGVVDQPDYMRRNSRRVLYYELFHASLDLSAFLEPDPVLPGMVIFAPFAPEQLVEHPALQVVRSGLLEGQPFVLD